MSEVWKPVPEWEGEYSVSNLGRVRSEDRYIIRKSNHDGSLKKRSGHRVKYKGRLLKPVYPGTQITPCVHLYRSQHRINIQIRYIMYKVFKSEDIDDKVKEFVKWQNEEK